MRYTIGQTVKTATGEQATIHNIELWGDSTFYVCWVSGLGTLTIHETKLAAQ